MPTVNGTPEQIQQLVHALIAAQAAMPDAAKDSKNPHFKSTYASLQSVRTAVMPSLQANGFALAQLFEPGADGHVVVVTTLLHAGGGFLESRLAIAALKKDPQAYGSAITYGRRYALAAICGIASDEDDDGNTTGTWPPAADRQQVPPPRQQLPPPPTPPRNSATGAPAPASTVPPALAFKKAVWEELLRQVGGTVADARDVLSAILPGRTSMEHMSDLEVRKVDLVMKVAVICDGRQAAQMTIRSLQDRIGTQRPIEQWTEQHVEAAWAAARGQVAGQPAITPQVLPPANGGAHTPGF